MSQNPPFKFYPGWAEVEGRKVQRGRPDPRTIYTPRVDGVMPRIVAGVVEGVEPDADDPPESEDMPVAVDVMLRRKGIQ